ncbi:sulfocyanin-like copper-binding protein [Phyllobacterium bourgognense]|uniref:Sulfocyanin SoxE-like protein n=1 Tax=Phyllobacterium bourgognense TaxID=314236 RepID=A0A368YY96_9HYPH|nr:sulfocyanin-like copper-binding protein [Phyllobacterium bourgognense]RCW85163.1 sulfocyanin SoxE-like protein [Phyllobacterium bourgognense]
MACRAHIAFLAFIVLGLLPGIALAGEPFVPSWIKNVPAAKTVAIEIVADWNQVERYRRDNIRTDIIDFNGYWGGNLTIIVPTDWSVEITFINGSLSFPHSLMVTRVYAQSEMPVKLTAKDAVWGAYTDPPEGIKYNERRQINFVAMQAGKYFLACARQTHLMDGHWIGFEVRNNLDQAVAVVHDDKFPQDQPAGRP